MQASFMFAVWMLFLATPGCVLCSAAGLQERLYFQNSKNPVDKIQAPSGGNVVLECEAGGNPTPLIRWMRKGRQIVQGESGLLDDLESFPYSHRRRTSGLKSVLFPQTSLEEERRVPEFDLGLTKSRLFLDCVSAADAGIYTCEAETITKKISMDFQLNVDGASSDSAAEGRCREIRFAEERISRRSGHFLWPEDDTKKGSLGMAVADAGAAAARIYLWTMQRVVLEGSDLQLFCRASGSPAPVVTWFDPENKPIDDDQPNGQYEVLPNGDLLVKNINWIQNMGLYRCVAQNEAGLDEISTFVYPTAAEKSS